MKRSTRMTNLAELAHLEEQAAAGQLAEARANLAREQASLETLKTYLVEYQNRARTNREQNSPRQMADFAKFINQLNTAIQDQSQRVALYAQRYEMCQLEWRARHVRVDALQKVSEQSKKQEQSLIRKRADQQLIDRVPLVHRYSSEANAWLD
ncbi:flagellar export protein FliJ [Pseudomonadales bacterium]|nr:flagellar export protein FliJ [Pseudomonadales bacterium]